jgi:two-component system phosphate regulon response regulator PhoB
MSQPKHILIVEDEHDLAEVMAFNLQKAGYRTSASFDGRQALDSALTRTYDLVLLDVMLPGLSGTDVAARLRSNPATAKIPIIMVTAKSEEVDQLVGLTVGADDYITKPFSPRVLLARIEAVLRRTSQPAGAQSRVLSLGKILVNLDTHDAEFDGEVVKLTLTEFRLLAALLADSGRVLSRAVLISRAIGPGITVTERTIDVHLTALRKKLGSQAGLIQTVRGVGYRAIEDASAEV